ncbi:MAG TPA: hypothetical protein VND65_09200 [Candidatus Binatia bacterium]|nr:hypothetical protein [Candidatus Binatia bacterium]
MRTFPLVCWVLLLSAVAFGQERGIAGYCPYGCGPYVPLISTPSLTFTNVSANPVGATNATGGLVAGATDSTLSEPTVNTSASYSVPVWYSGGGSPLVAPAVNSPVGSMKMNPRAEYREHMEHMEHAQHEREAAQPWVYIASAREGAGSLAAISASKGVHPSKHSYTNEDVQRQNDSNGNAHWDGKTEKIQ